MRHELKTDPQPFKEVWSGVKLYEIRKDDRPRIPDPQRAFGMPGMGFEISDELLLRETRFSAKQMQDGRMLEYTGREILCRVTNKLTGYGLQDGWCILGIARLELIDSNASTPVQVLPPVLQVASGTWNDQRSGEDRRIDAKQMSNSSGHHVSYYSVDIGEPSKGGQPYRAEAIDCIAALDMTFSEGEAFKAIWRCAADRIGAHKEGNDTFRDAEKVKYYGEQMMLREKRRHAKS